jgi:hypothetical protein
MKITEAVQNFGLTFLRGTFDVLFLSKSGLGYILGDFFTNSSCRPELWQQFHSLAERGSCLARKKSRKSTDRPIPRDEL